MRVKILAFGKIGRGEEQSLIDEYLRRLPWQTEIVEFDIKKPAATIDLRKQQEAEKLLAAIPDSATVVVLDERGKSVPSRKLAETLDAWATDGISTIVFIIGGADGLHDSVRKRASLILSFGAMTWPHKLVRVMLIEQLYRAWSITIGHPYHRD